MATLSMRNGLLVLSLAGLGSFSLSSSGCGSYVKYDGNDPTQRAGDLTDSGLAVELTPAGTFDHSLLSSVLTQYVSLVGEQALLDYDGIAANPLAVAALNAYRADLASVDPEALQGQSQRLAFWLNAYNANVIGGVLASYQGNPEFSVITSGTFFNTRAYLIAGLMLSLDEVEHAVIRGDWDHPNVAGSPSEEKLRVFHASLWGKQPVNARIHVALNCAALSCPNLLQKAWLPGTLPQDLQKALEAFLADPLKGAGGDGVSLLFTYYKTDFDAEAGSVSAFIDQNRKGGLSGVEVGKSLEYDWALNIKR